jgi:thiol-disulfide isomerase/thioredoxin
MSVALLAASLFAAPAPTPATLKVGDPAPPFKADKWLQGDPVARFEPGRVYVVEFWATWCWPCVGIMPHLADLQDEYRAKGVTVVGFSSAANDRREPAERFVRRRGPKLGYAFAWADADATHAAWMTAAGRGGVPCSFVVGTDGRLAYIGHPMFLDEVLPRVVAGTWDPAKGAEAVEAGQRDYDRAQAAAASGDVAGFDALLTARPTLANVPYLIEPRLKLLVRSGRFADAKAVAEAAVAKAARRGDGMALGTVSAVLSGAGAKGQAELLAVAVRAAEANLALAGDRDTQAVLGLAEVYAAGGRGAEARAMASKVLPQAEKVVTGDADIWNNLQLAQAQFLAGQPDTAKATAGKAVAAAKALPAKTLEYVTEQARKYGYEPPAGGGSKGE